MSPLEQVPGYSEAAKRESFIRDSSFVPVAESLCGFEVKAMTLEDFMALRILRSPFLVGGEPQHSHVRAFLWRLNPKYAPGNGWRRWVFMRQCRAFLPPAEPIFKTRRAVEKWASRTLVSLELYGRLLIAIREYVDDTLQDWGSTKSQSAGNTISYFSDCVAIIGMIAREYGWAHDAILKLPMKGALQFVKEIRQSHGEKVLFNRSDRILFEHSRKENSLVN